MGNVKLYRMLLVPLLILSVFTSGVTAEACLCGEACLHGLQYNQGTRVNTLFHHHCSGTCCKGCNLEDGQTLKKVCSSTPTAHLKIFQMSSIIAVFTNSQSENNLIEVFYSRTHTCIKAHSSPTFLQNLSLRF